MTAVLEPPVVTPVAADLPLSDAVPWVVREEIAPTVRREGDSLWLESNGSEGCYGGWELRFPVPAGVSEGDELVFELHAEASDLARDSDALVAEAFWHGADEKQCDWDPVFFDGGYPRA